jgi:hypothetical protein
VAYIPFNTAYIKNYNALTPKVFLPETSSYIIAYRVYLLKNITMQLSAEEFARRISNENYAWWLANNKKPLE